MLPDYPCQFQEQACARAAVVSSHELYGIKRFGVVMRAQQEQGPLISLAAKLGNQINELDLASRGVVRERLACYVPVRTAELLLDVLPGFFNRFRSGRARPEVDQLLNMRESFLTGKFFPNLRLRRA
jgi:hypothetical protein